MDFIPREENPETGERIITSGMDNVYPAGILIGKIESVDLSQNQLFTKVVIAPDTNFLKLEKVFIIKTK
jgi:rod shape-determining protein MreC